MEKFRIRLKELRDSIGIPAYEVSRECYLSENSIRNYERGDSIPRADSLISIAKFFGVSTDYLLGLSDEK